MIVQKILRYLNPMVHLGERRYAVLFPLLVNIVVCILSEAYTYGIAKSPLAVGNYIIFVNVILVIYFSFREGLRGGFIASAIAIDYYFYIIYTRHYTGGQLTVGVITTVILGVIYFFIGFIIGWLKEEIDRLIETQADERKRLETIIQQLPVGAIITDNVGRVTHINKNVNRILGVKIPIGFKIGEDNLPNAKINDKAIIPTSAPSFNTLTTGKPIIGREILFESKHGKKTFIQVNTAPIQNSKKKLIAVATTISDITPQKEINQQKDDFLNMVSHELKTPITSLKMFVDLQQKQLEKKDLTKTKYFNGRIRDQVNRLKELTNDLLDVSGIQTGKLHYTFNEFDISKLVYETVEALQGTTNNHKMTLTNARNLYVRGDRYRIYQVLVNLLSNAIKYSPEGKKIIIKVNKHKQDVVVSVQDFGIGVDKEQQQRIFDRLYQINQPNAKTFPGLGLGLYISKEIIQRHKGKLWVESTKGKGSKFYFSLPLIDKNTN